MARVNATSTRTAEVTISIALDSYRRHGDPIVKNNVLVSSFKASSVLLMVVRFDIRTEPIHVQFIFSNRHRTWFRGQEHRRLQILQAGLYTMGIFHKTTRSTLHGCNRAQSSMMLWSWSEPRARHEQARRKGNCCEINQRGQFVRWRRNWA